MEGLAVHALLQAAHLAYICTAEAIYGLLGIADHEQFAALGRDCLPVAGSLLDGRVGWNGFCEEHRDFRLNQVGVLYLVDEQVREAAAEVVACVEVVAQHVSRPDEQVVEACASLPLALIGVVEHECPERG